MRTFLFKPRYIPGFRPTKPRKRYSVRYTVIVFTVSVAMTFAMLAGVYLSAVVVTLVWATSSDSLPKSVDEMPLWMVAVGILGGAFSPFLFFFAVARLFRIRVFERIAQFTRNEEQK